MGRVCCVFFVVASVTVREHCSSGIWVVGCCSDTSVMSAILPRGSLHVTDTPKTDMSTVFLHPSCAKVKVVLALPINALSDMLENVLRVLVFFLVSTPTPTNPLAFVCLFFQILSANLSHVAHFLQTQFWWGTLFNFDCFGCTRVVALWC